MNCVFYSGLIRTLVAMATYSSHRLIMGKIFSLKKDIIMEFIFTEMFIEKSSTFHMAFVQIAEFDWLPGQLKGLILEKISETIRWMKLILYIYVYDIILYINNVFCFC